MKQLLNRNKLKFTLVLFFIINLCQAQDNKAKILNNQSIELKSFVNNAHIIDKGEVSYWAYHKADSLLSSIDLTGKSYFQDLNKIYSAYTYVFYGMSYNRSIRTISKGKKYSLEELVNTIIQPSNKITLDYYNLSKNELSSIYSMINFYKVSEEPRFNSMYALFQEYAIENERVFKNYPLEKAYRIASLENKKLYYMIFVNMIIDVYLINNPNIEETEYNKYIQNLIKLGNDMDGIPSDYHIIQNLSEKEYYKHILKSSKIQRVLIGLLVSELETLKQ